MGTAVCVASSAKVYPTFRVLNATELESKVKYSHEERTALWKKLRLYLEDRLPQVSYQLVSCQTHYWPGR